MSADFSSGFFKYLFGLLFVSVKDVVVLERPVDVESPYLDVRVVDFEWAFEHIPGFVWVSVSGKDVD